LKIDCLRIGKIYPSMLRNRPKFEVYHKSIFTPPIRKGIEAEIPGNWSG
jgi:hypothetical protein